jgi:hypothetical protein
LIGTYKNITKFACFFFLWLKLFKVPCGSSKVANKEEKIDKIKKVVVPESGCKTKLY